MNNMRIYELQMFIVSNNESFIHPVG